MIRPTKEKFAALAEQGDLVPVYARFHDDLDTPVSAYLTLADYAPGQRFLLESVEGGENIGRYSFLGLAPHTILVGKNGKAKLTRNGKTTDVEYGDKPLEMLKDLLSDGAPSMDSFVVTDKDYGEGRAVKNHESGVEAHRTPQMRYHGPFDTRPWLEEEVKRMNVFRRIRLHCIGLGEADMALLRSLAQMGNGDVFQFGAKANK